MSTYIIEMITDIEDLSGVLDEFMNKAYNYRRRDKCCVVS